MGLCPSRAKKTAETLNPPPGLEPQSKLRADAEPFQPQVARAAWEEFLERKELQRLQPQLTRFQRKLDGTFTQEYRRLLGGDRQSTKQTEEPMLDFVQAWKELKTGKGPSPPPGLIVKDDAALPKPQPFGLSDQHYLSGDEDSSRSQAHRCVKPAQLREYVPGPVSAELEEALTELLYELRTVQQADRTLKRYCVGLREVLRAAKAGTLQACVVAPDLDPGESVDVKLQELLKKCTCPVVFGLSRKRLGQCIKKSVTVSVVGILDSRGAQASFDRMMAAK